MASQRLLHQVTTNRYKLVRASWWWTVRAKKQNEKKAEK
jgi:hypothetical protein